MRAASLRTPLFLGAFRGIALGTGLLFAFFCSTVEYIEAMLCVDRQAANSDGA